MILVTEHEVKDAEGQIILDAIAERFGYTPTDVNDAAQTKQEFYQKWLLEKTLMEVESHLLESAAVAAKSIKKAEIEKDIKPELEQKIK